AWKSAAGRASPPRQSCLWIFASPHQSAPKAKGATKQKGTACLFPVSCFLLVFAVCCLLFERRGLRLLDFYSETAPRVQRKISVVSAQKFAQSAHPSSRRAGVSPPLVRHSGD